MSAACPSKSGPDLIARRIRARRWRGLPNSQALFFSLNLFQTAVASQRAAEASHRTPCPLAPIRCGWRVSTAAVRTSAAPGSRLPPTGLPEAAPALLWLVYPAFRGR